MTTAMLARSFMQAPFEPFTLVLSNGRELHVHQPEFTDVDGRAQVVVFQHPSGQVEIVDPTLIVSIRTIYGGDLGDYRTVGPSANE